MALRGTDIKGEEKVINRSVVLEKASHALSYNNQMEISVDVCISVSIQWMNEECERKDEEVDEDQKKAITMPEWLLLAVKILWCFPQ